MMDVFWGKSKPTKDLPLAAISPLCMATGYKLPAWRCRFKCVAVTGKGMPFLLMPAGDSFNLYLSSPGDTYGARLDVEDVTVFV